MHQRVVQVLINTAEQTCTAQDTAVLGLLLQ